MIKVDHAGEHGAVCIYSAQLWIAQWTARNLVAELVEFREHEKAHRAIFAAELQRRGHKRCRSYWICGVGGYILGVVTGLLGRNAIAATTTAIENVVLKHLDHQVAALRDRDLEAVAAIERIIDDERAHRDQSNARMESGSVWRRVLSPVVSGSTEAVIWIGMRL